MTKEINDTLAAFRRLSDILDTLRKECPWDRVQTMKSLRYLTIEEVHELSEAIIQIENFKLKIENGETDAASANSQFSILNSQLKKELGDVAMHLLFYCKIAEDEGLFTTADVYNAISDKLIARHPFIYDKENYHGENWEQLKMREGRKNVLEGVPDSLPTLVKTVRMQEKVAGSEGQRFAPLRSQACEAGRKEKGETTKADDDANVLSLPFTPSHSLSLPTNEEEFGELLFDLVDWGRRHGINADYALALANRRFKEEHSI